jgi:opacity protein-like surface antigen
MFCLVAASPLKKLPLLLVAILGFAGSLRAGEPVEYKQVATPPPELYGTGFYGAIDLGANILQNRGDAKTFTEQFDRFATDTVKINSDNNAGFFGGIKLGYVFSTGILRPTIEGDFFYNGFPGDADFKLREVFDPCGGAPGCLAPIFLITRHGHVSNWINTGAFMGNFILRFALGRFQPYAGAGVGAYYAESTDLEIKTPFHTFTADGENHADLAWQILAGTDYYWNPKLSTFIEYRWLHYTSSQIDTREDRDLAQHLLGAGLRIHF